jgi:hypothetical protein
VYSLTEKRSKTETRQRVQCGNTMIWDTDTAPMISSNAVPIAWPVLVVVSTILNRKPPAASGKSEALCADACGYSPYRGRTGGSRSRSCSSQPTAGTAKRHPRSGWFAASLQFYPARPGKIVASQSNCADGSGETTVCLKVPAPSVSDLLR